MTTRQVIEIDTIFFLFIAVAVGVVVALYANHSPKNRVSFSLPAVVQNVQNQLHPSPFISPLQPSPTIPPLPKPQTFSQVSPDGTKTLSMTVKTNIDTTKTFTFNTSDTSGANNFLIYQTTLAGAENMSVPFNAWSPDDNYIFLQANRASDSGALVMKASGQALADGQQYDNVTTLFNNKQENDAYKQTTGWASETLLIIETTKADGTNGTSYWYEVPSKAVIPLSTQF